MAKSIKRLDSGALWEYALKALGLRAHSSGELRQKLLRKAERAEDVPEILARLKEYGFLNDERFAQAYSAARLENQGLGKARVIRELRARRVAPGLAQKAADQTYQGCDEAELARQYIERKYRAVNLSEYLSEPKHLASAYRRLRTAGFSSGTVIRVLKRYAEDPGALDNFEEPEA